MEVSTTILEANMKSSGWENRFSSIMRLFGGESTFSLNRGGAIGTVMGVEGN